MNKLENENLLDDSMLGNKITCSCETKCEAFIGKMNNKINNNILSHIASSGCQSIA